MDTPVVTVAVIVVLLADAVDALFVARKRRSPDLREGFGLRYDRSSSAHRRLPGGGSQLTVPPSRARRRLYRGSACEREAQPLVRQPAAGNLSAGRSRSRPTGCPPSTATSWSYGSGGRGALLGWDIRLERPASVEDLSATRPTDVKL